MHSQEGLLVTLEPEHLGWLFESIGEAKGCSPINGSKNLNIPCVMIILLPLSLFKIVEHIPSSPSVRQWISCQGSLRLPFRIEAPGKQTVSHKEGLAERNDQGSKNS
ncbi:hypothetical protein KY290_022129 [Solanum tuberosum]|uniref:Uncharacterized protein n=1 Tax=Solanum tuberosum TaxID=4113 RepID=A0ABQ7V3J4_SOLTU|nr:hypothetical protein KY289_022556 [Solanum tuberosum]KAH0758636.1 hypothetical protein KY290_022129 [Solanum tuberosum]